MRFAEKNGQRILPNPFEKNAVCPLCKEEVISKCGEIKIWHWAHKSNNDCDNWGGRETAWHLNWKGEFPEETQEVIIGKHRADVKIQDIVLEFQSSSISLEKIKEREEFYDRMIWILNGGVFAENLCLRDNKGFKSFRWKWPPNAWLNATRPIYVDLQPLVDKWIKSLSLPDREPTENGYLDRTKWKENLRKEILEYSGKLFLIKKVYNSLPCGGWGKLITKEDFLRNINNGYYRD